MNPQPTRLTRPVRIAIMLSLIIIFFIVAPVIILYTAGYRYSVAEFRIVRTGVISIDVRPRNATVYLNNVAIDKGLPLRLGNRASGTYTVRIEAPGYHTWEKSISVESNKTTYIRDLVLPEVHIPEAIDFFVPDADYVFHAAPNDPIGLLEIRQGDIVEIGVFTPQSNTFEPLMRKANTDTIDITWSPFLPIATVQVTPPSGTSILYLIDPIEQKISEGYSLPKDTWYQWDTAREKIYLQTNKRAIQAITVTEATTIPLVTSSESWYVLPDDTIVTVSKSNGIDQTVRYEALGTSYTLPKQIDHIELLTERVLIGSSGNEIKLYKKNEVDFSHIATISDAQIMRYGERDMLIWSASEIWSISPEAHASLLFRTSNPISYINTFDSFGSLLLTTATGLHIYNPGYITNTQILERGDLRSTLLDTQNNRIYVPAIFGNVRDMYVLEY